MQPPPGTSHPSFASLAGSPSRRSTTPLRQEVPGTRQYQARRWGGPPGSNFFVVKGTGLDEPLFLQIRSLAVELTQLVRF